MYLAAHWSESTVITATPGHILPVPSLRHIRRLPEPAKAVGTSHHGVLP
jgi:hypothetical protein